MKTYDTQMIRDFIEHLLWESRVAQYERAHRGAVNPELAEQPANYVKKYGAFVPGVRHPQAMAMLENVAEGLDHILTRMEVQQYFDRAPDDQKPLWLWLMAGQTTPTAEQMDLIRDTIARIRSA